MVEVKLLAIQETSNSRWLRYWPVGLGGLVLAVVCVINGISFERQSVYESLYLEDAALETPDETLSPNFLADEPLEAPAPAHLINPTAPPLPTPVPAPARLEDPWQAVIVQPGDTLQRILQKLGVPARRVYDLLKSDKQAQQFTALKPGQTLHYRLENTELQALMLELSLGHQLLAHKTAEGFEVKQLQKALQNRLNSRMGEVTSSLSASARAAGLDKKIISQMVDIFGWDINFAQDIRQNDRFRVLFEEKHLDGKKVATGDILAIEFINQGRKYQAVRYTDAHGVVGYYSPDGASLQKAFIRTPLKFSRISSHFGRRRHPVLHTVRQHKGVDYAAPTGTPIKAMGNAKVVFAGTKSGYGKVIILQHGPKYRSLYAHLSRFAPGIRNGATVLQSQLIGFVGTSGLSTGAHLHLELIVNGVHQDPVKYPLPRSHTIDANQREKFQTHAKELIRLLDEDPIKLAAQSA